MSLFIRLSDSDLCFARYEAGTPTDFDFATFHLAPQASLTLNLRGAMQQVGLLQHDFDLPLRLRARCPAAGLLRHRALGQCRFSLRPSRERMPCP